MAGKDQLYRFLFESFGIRGGFVQLGASWQAVLENHDYPDPVRDRLGQALAGVLLLSTSIKFKGSLVLQVQAEGPLRTLVAQATDTHTVRAMARWSGEVPDADVAAVFGPGRLVFTAESPGGQRYQGVVGLEGAQLGEALQAYFNQSEQLPTRFYLAADGDTAAGLFLQELPAAKGKEGGWAHVTALADTVTRRELLELDVETLLHRLFHEDRVRLFDPEPTAYRCGCSREKVETALRGMGRAEMEQVLAQEGVVTADCEFCNRQYRFDAVDVAALFAEGDRIGESVRVH